MNFLHNIFISLYKHSETCIIRFWWYLPLSRTNKERLKTLIFNIFPFFFKRTRVYRNWNDGKSFSNGPVNSTNSYETRHIDNGISDSGSGVHFISEPIGKEQITKLAIIIHAFYFDIFVEIINFLKNNNAAESTLYITSPYELSEKIRECLKNTTLIYKYLPVENLGRDILPFLKILPLTLNDGHQLILKIHTKKSDHRKTGRLWREDLYNKLLKESAMKQALAIFNADHTVGLIGAPGHIVPMNLYYGANACKVESIGRAMGVPSSEFSNLNFPAGSMFYARKQALIPILNLELADNDFEKENGQNDGTMAHAVERAFAISTLAANLKMVDTSFDQMKGNLNIIKDHPYIY